MRRFVWVLLLPLSPVHVAAQDAAFESLEEASAIQESIRENRLEGDAEAAWELEQALLRLAVQNPDDVRSARILRDAGDYRLDILARYSAGEFPAEIVLGCYYFQTPQYAAASRRGSQPLTSGSGRRADSNTCATGSNRRAMRALVTEALGLYVESARILMYSEQATDDELEELIMKAVATSYRVLDYRTGLSSLRALLSYQEANSASSLARAQTLALIGDWDVLFAPHFGNRYSDSAADTYEEAIALLVESGASDEAVDSVFYPERPILLPAYASNGALSRQADDATGYLDVSFEVRMNGKSARIDVLDSSEDIPRAVQRDIVNTIRHGRFRPLAADGQLLESAPVTVRYYINNDHNGNSG